MLGSLIYMLCSENSNFLRDNFKTYKMNLHNYHKNIQTRNLVIKLYSKKSVFFSEWFQCLLSVKHWRSMEHAVCSYS